MARLYTSRSTTNSFYRGPTPARREAENSASPPSTPEPSDKENLSTPGSALRSVANGKRPMASTGSAVPQASSRKRRLQEQGARSGAQVTSQRRRISGEEEEDDADKRFYDPEQNPEERRHVRMELRKNARELHDRADEFLNAENHEQGLIRLIENQNYLFENVKQTSDATVDSRFLVGASELTLKKSKRLAFGDGATGIDIDEFVSKCITFMKHGRSLGGDEPEPDSTTRANLERRTRGSDIDSGEDDDNDGNGMNWHLLGAGACFPSNRRPTCPNFLLGPLSVQKRHRAATQRRTQVKEKTAALSRPQELQAADLERHESSNLTTQCSRIRARLQELTARGLDLSITEEMDEESARAAFAAADLETNYEVSLFKFAINPRSFAQTVENLFYLSFLVKDGFVVISTNEDDGLPTIRPAQPGESAEEEEGQSSGKVKRQAIFSLDYKTWEALVEALALREPLIRHREEEPTQVAGATGWYS